MMVKAVEKAIDKQPNFEDDGDSDALLLSGDVAVTVVTPVESTCLYSSICFESDILRYLLIIAVNV
jgi:hypothetical protein